MIQELLNTGGPVMYILLVCSIAALAIIIERSLFWIKEFKVNPINNFEGLNSSEAFKASEQAFQRATKNLTLLDTVVSIAPLLGILGTVLGIMKSFHGLDLKHMSGASQISHGLAEAMLTTAAGLCIAVPVLVCYNLFQSMARRRAKRIYNLAR